MKLYVDDLRETTNEWTHAYTYEQAIVALKSNQVEVLSLDHDLGACVDCGGTIIVDDNYYSLPVGVPPRTDLARGPEKTCVHVKNGYDVLTALEQWVFEGFKSIPDFIAIHSANPVGRANMDRAIESINRMWESRYGQR
jgi:hypothetical protein